MNNVKRRKAIKSGVMYPAIIALGCVHPQLKANQSIGAQGIIGTGVNELANALRSMENDVCDAAAENLEKSFSKGTSLYLHLRNAGLDLSNALSLAEALLKHSNPTNIPLRSFSASYNHELGDSGVKVLAKALPQTLEEIGFVDCNIEDRGGEAILQWATHAPNLKMICIEGNSFSTEMVSLFNVYKKSNPEIMLFL